MILVPALLCGIICLVPYTGTVSTTTHPTSMSSTSTSQFSSALTQTQTSSSTTTTPTPTAKATTSDKGDSDDGVGRGIGIGIGIMLCVVAVVVGVAVFILWKRGWQLELPCKKEGSTGKAADVEQESHNSAPVSKGPPGKVYTKPAKEQRVTTFTATSDLSTPAPSSPTTYAVPEPYKTDRKYEALSLRASAAERESQNYADPDNPTQQSERSSRLPPSTPAANVKEETAKLPERRPPDGGAIGEEGAEGATDDDFYMNYDIRDKGAPAPCTVSSDRRSDSEKGRPSTFASETSDEKTIKRMPSAARDDVYMDMDGSGNALRPVSSEDMYMNFSEVTSM